MADLSRAEALEELRRLTRKAGKPVGAKDLPSRLWFVLQRHFGSIHKARRAAGVAGPERPRRWSKEIVIAEIRAVHRQGIEIVARKLVAAGRHDLAGAITAYFGSIVRARRAARVPDPSPHQSERRRWDAQQVSEEILARHREGEPLAPSKAPLALVKAGQRYYDSWQDAIEAAGLDYDQIRLQHAPYSRAEILEELRRLAARRPGMTAGEMQTQRFYPALIRFFRTQEDAVLQAGIHDWPHWERPRAMSRTATIVGLQARWGADRPLGWYAVQQDDRNLWYSAILHFGHWRNALERAGVDDDATRRRWSAEEILAVLRDRHRRGLSLKPADVQREDPRLYFSVRNYFPTYLEAARRVAPTPWALTRWTPELLVQRLRKAAAGSAHITARRAGHTLVTACQSHYGSFAAACRAAGLICGHRRRQRAKS